MATRSLSFPKSRRLTKPAQFEQVKKDGRVQRGSFLLLSVLKKAADGRFCAGFVTSRALGSAVKRNRVRRRLREIVRKHQAEVVAGMWVVTIARQRAGNATYEQLEGEWLRLAKRAFILGA